eukprot:TRINITY_DN460_c0_g1_i1.p1 TRINITY_DN460_c0_g1~~TRINITY_DN460_c0_g1_i1.p1  ORF type:complete len:284 (+),score=86.94 TRINITY_DN460_c0_g1_i1:125-976(+)
MQQPQAPYQNYQQPAGNPPQYQGYQAGQPQLYPQQDFNQGQYQQQPPYQDIEAQKDPLLPGLSDTELRLGFIRKVYSILTIQLTITTLICCLPFFSDDVRLFQRQNPALIIVSCVLVMITGYAITCYKDLARSYPTNYILLLIFTVAEAYGVSFVCSFYEPKVVLIAAALTAAATFALTLYACTTKTDFTYLGGLLFVCAICLLGLGITAIFYQTFLMYFLYLILGVILYSIYLIYDTQLIIGGDHSFQLGLDDYVVGALVIYIDIIILFLRILRIVALIMKK